MSTVTIPCILYFATVDYVFISVKYKHLFSPQNAKTTDVIRFPNSRINATLYPLNLKIFPFMQLVEGGFEHTMAPITSGR